MVEQINKNVRNRAAILSKRNLYIYFLQYRIFIFFRIGCVQLFHATTGKYEKLSYLIF